MAKFNTNQEVFDHIAAHLKKQGKRAMVEGGTCAYLGDDGAMCAIGACFDNPKYVQRKTNGGGFLSALSEIPQVMRRTFGPDTSPALFVALQDAHDGAESDVWDDGTILSFRQRLIVIAKAFKLKRTALGKGKPYRPTPEDDREKARLSESGWWAPASFRKEELDAAA